MMEDMEAMFHQVRVKPQDCDVLRYLWWPDGDLDSEPVVYRMTVHLIGGTWSPSCCTYAMRRTAQDKDPYDKNTFMNDFYVDDWLKSLEEEENGIKLAAQLCELMSKRGFKLANG